MRVLFPLHGFVEWNGGLDLVRLITAALNSSQPGKMVELHFAMPEPSLFRRSMNSLLRRARAILAGNRIHSADAGSTAMLRRVASDIAAGYPVIRCADTPGGVMQAAAQVTADIVFPTMLPLGKTDLPRIGYLFDFQHRYLPELFSARTRRNRDKRFARIASDADGIVVNSKAAAQDVTRFLGINPEHVLAMPFAPYALAWWFDVEPDDAQHRHGVGGRYLLVCNHFWKHKDHATALQAFALLKQAHANSDLQLVLTGDPIDHRAPQHYGRLIALARSLGVANQTHFLGLIPKRDQLALMRGCAALLQPTLFEGGPGGGSVYEAVGLGIPAVVSDIAVNREIDVGNLHFFHAGDPSDLAAKTTQVLASPLEKPEPATLLADGNVRLARLGDAIVDFLEGILANRVGRA